MAENKLYRFNKISVSQKSSVNYQFKRSKVHSPKKQDKLETNQRGKQKHREQRLGLQEHLIKEE